MFLPNVLHLSGGSTPMVVFGASADRMRVALAEARDFIAQSCLYQDSLLREIEAAKTQVTAGGQPFEPMIETSARLMIVASQKAQGRAGASVNGAVTASKLARTSVPPQRATRAGPEKFGGEV